MTRCRPCTITRQLVFNVLLGVDLLANSILAGNPRETISHRTARARAAGSEAAEWFCGVLTWLSNALGFPQADHCTWALDTEHQTGPELWHWTTPVPSFDGPRNDDIEPINH